MTRPDPVTRVLQELRSGRPVLVVDDESRENEGDLICAAQFATPELVSFLVRYSSGFLCAALPDHVADGLDLPPMVRRNQDPRGTAYTVTVDARKGVGTGISARDRAYTARLLADPAAKAEDFTRPGHVQALRARPGGVLERRGHTETTVDLLLLGGLAPVGVLCEVVSEREPTRMARLPELTEFAARHELSLIRVDDIVRYRRRRAVQRAAEARLPLPEGRFDVVGYREAGGAEHVALVLGDVADGRPVPMYRHQECLMGDVLGSQRCCCGAQLREAIGDIAAVGRGVLMYLRGQNRLDADPVACTRRAGRRPRALLRSAGSAPRPQTDVVATILDDLRIRSVQLLGGDAEEVLELRREGFSVETTDRPVEAGEIASVSPAPE